MFYKKLKREIIKRDVEISDLRESLSESSETILKLKGEIKSLKTELTKKAKKLETIAMSSCPKPKRKKKVIKNKEEK